MPKSHPLASLFRELWKTYGPQRWWPGESPYEVMVGAVLTQNTGWKNVEKAIDSLKANDLLDPDRLLATPPSQLAPIIRSSGYFNQKALRLIALTRWYVDGYGASHDRVRQHSLESLREELLAIKGIGPETADSILLYAFDFPIFVVDTYTWRILVRHHFLDADADYQAIQEFFHDHLMEDASLYNDFHALLVKVGHNHCRRTAHCEECPLAELSHTADLV